METFRGRKVTHNTNGYPWVYWPEHPESFENGQAYIHRVVVYEENGGIPSNCHVHHIDGNKDNWSNKNLKLVKSTNHRQEHFPLENIECESCGNKFSAKPSSKRKYCSPTCSNRGREKIDWPSQDKLQKKVDKKGYSKVGRDLGVSDNAVRNRLSG